jgi:photosystem II stability/assembly factor-like uncharacterized protein
MGRTQSFDNAWDVYAMSTYNTVTSLSESRIDENILYAGTDDGIIQYTKDGGANWSKMTVDNLPNTPSSAFVNDIKADLHDTETAYVLLDNHKFGDYKPYIFKTSNGGKKWTSISEGIPDGTLLWRIVQDHVNPNLLFLGTEYGVYVSLNQGEKWHKFSNGLPTIPVRDMAIQKRENDLVLATFGRSFYILDDYSALRDLSEETLSKDGVIFKPRKALQFNQIPGGTSSDGGQTYYARNPQYGASITYFVKDAPSSMKSKRIKSEKGAKDSDIPFPGWEALDKENSEQKNQVILVVKDKAGEIITKISGPLMKGLSRVNWNLTSSMPTTINASRRSRGWSGYGGITRQVNPGVYDLFLNTRVDGVVTKIAGPVELQVEKIRSGTLANPKKDEHDQYYKNLADFGSVVNSYLHKFEKANTRVSTYQRMLMQITTNIPEASKSLYELTETMSMLERRVGGSDAKAEVGEKDFLTISDRLSTARGGWYPNSYGPTLQHMQSFDIAKEMFNRVKPEMDAYFEKVKKVGKILEEAGAPIVLD